MSTAKNSISTARTIGRALWLPGLILVAATLLVVALTGEGSPSTTRSVSPEASANSAPPQSGANVVTEPQPERESRMARALHVLLPTYVILLELIMLVRMGLESRERHETLSEFQSLRRHLDRKYYLQSIATETARTETIARFTSRSMETSENKEQNRIFEAVSERVKKGGVYEHKGILARRQEVLPGAIELILNAEKSGQARRILLRVSDVIGQSRLSFFVRDERVSILGIGKGEPVLNDPKPTAESVVVESTMLAIALERQFEELWKHSEPIEHYLDSLIKTMANDGMVHLSKAKIDRLFGHVAEHKGFTELLKSLSPEYAKICALPV